MKISVAWLRLPWFRSPKFSHNLESVLGYAFSRPELLRQALSHRSYVYAASGDKNLESNERLEFLGDAVLELAITEYLFTHHPDKTEGELSKMKSLVVSAKALGRCAVDLSLGDNILLSPAEKKAGGRKRQSILADCFEAVLGAVYLDGGLEAAGGIVRRFVIPTMGDLLKDESLVNYKSRLLESVQSRNTSAPEYRVLEETGPEHRKEFRVGVYINGALTGEGQGNTKKEAEQMAARVALDHEDHASA